MSSKSVCFIYSRRPGSILQPTQVTWDGSSGLECKMNCMHYMYVGCSGFFLPKISLLATVKYLVKERLTCICHAKSSNCEMIQWLTRRLFSFGRLSHFDKPLYVSSDNITNTAFRYSTCNAHQHIDHVYVWIPIFPYHEKIDYYHPQETLALDGILVVVW